MSDLSGATIFLAIWGLVTGFVGWGSCFRLIEPISNWLSPVRASATLATAVSRVIVAAFLIIGIISAISIWPLIMISGRGSVRSGSLDWRTLFGVAMMASLVGFVVHGAMQRFWGREVD